ncbi:MAG: hypothetical protein AAFP26_08435 [Planctomycetota bacterium]
MMEQSMAAVDRVIPTARPHLRLGLGTLALALAVGAGLPANAAPVVPTAQGEAAEARLTVINGRTFELADASQFETTARLVRPGEAGQGFGEGWVFRSEVIVKAEDERGVLEAMGRFAIAHAGGPQVDFVRTLSEKHGYFLLSRPSVGDAVELANWLNQSELVERAMLDHVPGRYGASLPVAAAPRVRDDLVTGANGAGVASPVGIQGGNSVGNSSSLNRPILSRENASLNSVADNGGFDSMPSYERDMRQLSGIGE